MMSQDNLGRSFENGATSGRASNVEIREAEGGYALVDTRGKGAVLAYRYPSGHIVAFEGWYGYTVSTSCMMTKLGLSVTCRHDEDRVYRANATAADAPTVRERAMHGYGTKPHVTLADWLDDHDPTHIGEAVSRD
jgi:hypothetical protein